LAVCAADLVDCTVPVVVAALGNGRVGTPRRRTTRIRCARVRVVALNSTPQDRLVGDVTDFACVGRVDRTVFVACVCDHAVGVFVDDVLTLVAHTGHRGADLAVVRAFVVVDAATGNVTADALIVATTLFCGAGVPIIDAVHTAGTTVWHSVGDALIVRIAQHSGTQVAVVRAGLGVCAAALDVVGHALVTGITALCGAQVPVVFAG